LEILMTNATLQDQLEAVRDEVKPNTDVIASRHAYFDPMEYLSDIMTSSRLRQALSANLVWSLDNQMISTAVRLYNEMIKDANELRTAPMNLQEQLTYVLGAFKGTYDRDTFWSEGNALKLVKLACLQPGWHDDAQRLAITAGYFGYEAKSIHEMIRDASVGETRAAVKENYRIAAKFAAEKHSTPECQLDADKLYEAMVLSDQANTAEMIDRRRRIASGVVAIIDAAVSYADTDKASFTNLDAVTRLSIVQGQQRKNTDQPTQLGRFVFGAEYGELIAQSYVYGSVLTRVIDRIAREVMATSSPD
jgi:hypothetical protein